MKQTRMKEWREQHIKQTCNALGITRKEYKRFLIIANKIHRINESQCNGYQDKDYNWDQKTSDLEEKQEKELRQKAKKMAKEKGLHIFFQGDPRGATIYLDKKEIPYNRYTDAYCIY